ncbi:hypothetical protein MCHI_003002 [Candidatus Magnetoovum chiemensis]|nr:hypothetical protein MCHI_003002 [Candidatus Magnetoovum chiemensis]
MTELIHCFIFYFAFNFNVIRLRYIFRRMKHVICKVSIVCKK